MRWLIVLGVLACGSSQTTTHSASRAVESGDLGAAMRGRHRSADERERDFYRHPRETLEHFGIRPDMTVVEIWPAAGWYTKILAPYLRDEGKLIAATMDPEDETFRGGFAREFRQLMQTAPAVYRRVETTVVFPSGYMPSVADESVDMVLSFRSVHNWIRWEGHAPGPYLQAIARVLRSGGTFGVVQHRAPNTLAHATDGTVGYLTEEHVIALATEAGLTLVDRSELNANTRDTHNHPDGVWSLPPTYRGGDTDRDRYTSIGESDRMTLTFRKP